MKKLHRRTKKIRIKGTEEKRGSKVTTALCVNRTFKNVKKEVSWKYKRKKYLYL